MSQGPGSCLPFPGSGKVLLYDIISYLWKQRCPISFFLLNVCV